ncbi:hypothetical protein PAPYR_11299 [Paratrimastix pyriformis]|uniref:Uncharacterized protein n=1 Tax=Paratrimastix pyriformis TaxID=342808 RepID=A0ABQ8UB93_9EUKA|nr:hypothetical protein PAPYR_11299 [Paratrimastix pyriformis]
MQTSRYALKSHKGPSVGVMVMGKRRPTPKKNIKHWCCAHGIGREPIEERRATKRLAGACWDLDPRAWDPWVHKYARVPDVSQFVVVSDPVRLEGRVQPHRKRFRWHKGKRAWRVRVSEGQRARCSIFVGQMAQCSIFVGQMARCNIVVGQMAQCSIFMGQMAQCSIVVGQMAQCSIVVGQMAQCSIIVGQMAQCSIIVGQMAQCSIVVGQMAQCSIFMDQEIFARMTSTTKACFNVFLHLGSASNIVERTEARVPLFSVAIWPTPTGYPSGYPVRFKTGGHQASRPNIRFCIFSSLGSSSCPGKPFKLWTSHLSSLYQLTQQTSALPCLRGQWDFHSSRQTYRRVRNTHQRTAQLPGQKRGFARGPKTGPSGCPCDIHGLSTETREGAAMGGCSCGDIMACYPPTA